MNEDNLIKGCRKGQRNCQEALYEKYSGSMYVVALRYSKMQQEAEDILQEAFVKVFANIKNFRKDSSLSYWIKRIVINTALNYQRSKLYLHPMSDVYQENRLKSGGEAVISSMSYQELIEIVQGLPVGCRMIFNLYAVEGYKHREIAEMLDISESTSKSQYARARTLLVEKIASQEKLDYASGTL